MSVNDPGRATGAEPPDPPPPGANEHFRTDHLLGDLKGRSVRGGAVIVAERLSTLVLKIGSMVVLARLLAPAEFGLVAMVTAFTGIVGRFRTLGLPSATVQRAQINHQQVSTLLWLNVAAGLALMLLGMIAAPAIALFYGEPRLTPICMALSAQFALGGLTVQHQALLRRQMRFTALASINVSAITLGTAAAIALAWSGAGYWALVAMPLVTAGTEASLAWLLCDWRPGLPRRVEGVRSMIAFGSNVAGASILNRLCHSVDNILIGMVWGAGPLGLYSKAYNLLKLPRYQIHAPLTKIALPSLSRLQGDPPRFRKYYQTGITVIFALAMPITTFALADAESLVTVVLGEAWRDAVPIFQMLAPAAFFGTLNAALMWVFIPLGRSDRQMRLAGVRTLLTVAAYLAGLPWGPIGVAAAYSTSRGLLVLPELLYAFAGTPLKLRDLGQAAWRPAATSLASAAVLAIIGQHLPALGSPAAQLLLEMAVFTLMYAMAWMAVPGGPQTLRRLAQLAQEIRRGKAKSAARLSPA